MRMLAQTIRIALLAASFGVVTTAAGQVYLPQREVVLYFETAAGASVTEAQLWLSRDAGRSWSPAQVELRGNRSIRFVPPADGEYGLYLVLVNAAGPSAEPPKPGTPPHTTVVVDTAAPVVQLHDARLEHVDGRVQVRLRVSMIEENLGTSGVRLFYRSPALDAWLDGGEAMVVNGQLTWTAPPTISGPLSLRLVVTDLAGNRTMDTLTDLPVPPPPPATQPVASAPAPATDPAETDTGPTPEPSEKPAEGVERRPETARTDASLPPPLTSNVARALSALRSAIRENPSDASARIDLARLLYRHARYDEAERQFQAAREIDPQSDDALEGLALVASTRQRYSEARDYLHDLVTRRPGRADFWLHYGDVENMLGNRDEAIAAWRQATQATQGVPKLANRAAQRLRLFSAGRSVGSAASIASN